MITEYILCAAISRVYPRVCGAFIPEAYNWLNKHYFDYRGLIPIGFALEKHLNENL